MRYSILCYIKYYVLVALQQLYEVDGAIIFRYRHEFPQSYAIVLCSITTKWQSGNLNRENDFDHQTTEVSLHLLTWNIFLIFYLIIPIIQDKDWENEIYSYILKYFQQLCLRATIYSNSNLLYFSFFSNFLYYLYSIRKYKIFNVLENNYMSV